VLADVLQELKPRLIDEVSARSKTQATGCLPVLVDELVQSLRQGSVNLKPWNGRFHIGLDLSPLLSRLRSLRECVYDLLEERKLVTSARESRVLADWFVAMTELALNEQNRRLGALLDAVPDFLVLKDREGRLVYANRSTCDAVRAAIGDPSVELLGKRITDLPLDSRFVRQADADMARALAGENVRSEARFPEPGGGRWREHHVSPVRDADGNVEGIAVASRDVHARKSAEARLRLLSKVGALAESMDYEGTLAAVAGLSIPDLADWCTIDVVENGQRRRGAVAHRDPSKAPLIEKLLQVSPELRNTAVWQEVLKGRSVIVTPRAGEQAACEVVRKLEAQSALVVPFVVLGSTIAVATFVVTADSGRRHEPEDLALAEELARRAGQIIENARLHQQLLRSESRFRIALAHAKVAIFEEDTDFRIRTMYNPQMGPLAEGMVGQNPAEHLGPEDAERMNALKRNLLATGIGGRVDISPAIDGEQHHLVVHYEPIRDASGAIVGIAGAGLDVTDEKRTQAELAEALGFREQMMGVLGHDLRNPLGAVLGLTELLRLQNVLTPRSREGLDRIDQAAKRMGEMIETLLDFTHSRFHGSVPIEPQVVDLVQVTENVVGELRAAHPGREIRLETNGSVRGEFDPARMAQVVSNLVGNALKHGAVDAPVELSLVGGASDTTLRVSNRGPAIPSELMGRLFEPFRRGSNGNGSRGLGLGLYIVREIVEAHHGSVDVQSNGDATVFSVHFAR
jgi:PAS domain S-box-containing protein